MQVKKDYQLIDLQKDFGPTTARDEGTPRCVADLIQYLVMALTATLPRLLYCGERITEHDTPESLDMEDGGTSDCLLLNLSSNSLLLL